MAIINQNQVIISNAGVPLEQTIISAHTVEISNDKVDSVRIRAQIGFFMSAEKMLDSPTNALKIEGFEGDKYEFKFNYPTNDSNVFYFFDQRIKEYIIQCFPSFDPDKLIITTTPSI